MTGDNTTLPPFWLVWNPKGEQPRRQHVTRGAAEAEAARLARLNPEAEFYVLCPVSCTRVRELEVRRFATEDIPF